MSSLKEAFQEFDELDDVIYDIDNKADIDKLKKSLDSDAEDDLDGVEKIVDINADDEEDLEQSYVGKLLLYCPFCHTIHYKAKDEIIENEDTPEYVNVGEQCPECDQIEGFEIIGEVAPVDEVKSDDEPENDEVETQETDEVDLDTEFGLPDEDEGDFEESLHKTKKSSFLERLVDNDCKNDEIDFDDNDGEEIEEKVGAVLPKVKKQVKENLKSKKLNENLTEAPLYDLKPQYDSRQSFYNKATVDTGNDGKQNKLYSYNTLVAEIKDGKPVVYGTYSQTTLRHIKDWLKQNGFKAESKAQIEKDYMTEGCKTNECNLNEEVQDEAYEIAEYVYEKIKDKDLVEWDEFEDLVNEATKELYDVDLYNTMDYETGKATINNKEFDINDLVNGDIRGILSYKGYATIFEGEHEGGLTTKEIEENLNEDSERDNLRANIKAQNQANRQPRLKLVKKDQAPKKDAHKDDSCKDDECKKKDLDEDLKILADMSDYEPWSGAVDTYNYLRDNDLLDTLDSYLEDIYPDGITMTQLNDILWFDSEWVYDLLGVNPNEDDDQDDDEVDDEIDENLFDNLINKYCTKVYENVKEYKTTTGYTQDNNLVLEGLLTFKSGKTANTKFIFEKKMIKENQVKYVGLNESFSKGKKAFALNCKVENNKILAESLSYNYKVNVDNQKKAVYGSVKNN